MELFKYLNPSRFDVIENLTLRFSRPNDFNDPFESYVTTFEQANELLQADPTIKESILDVELYNWYGSAALPVYIETHKKIEKRKFK